ncbi:unnamed protein product [Ranitomeya imitator]|uniref:Uncharacterized protein n=1 Tax=Ranitomeya imitator TaxID=111125 RepID=A0ABN9ME65_9NEOB|nr:unnamed protein product [Ranitomeya imitator]
MKLMPAIDARLQSFQSSLETITSHLTEHTSKISASEQRISDLEDTMQSYAAQVKDRDHTIDKLQEKFDDLENWSRRNNLRIIGIPEFDYRDLGICSIWYAHTFINAKSVSSRNELLAHLKNYNFYYEGQNLQLRHREEEEELIVEGLLNIFWGLRRPIRLQMQDDNERIRPPPSSTSWHSGCNLLSQGKVAQPATIPDIQVTEVEDIQVTEVDPPTVGKLNLHVMGSHCAS